MKLVKSVLVVTASKELDEEVKEEMKGPESSVANLLKRGQEDAHSRGDDGDGSCKDSE